MKYKVLVKVEDIQSEYESYNEVISREFSGSELIDEREKAIAMVKELEECIQNGMPTFYYNTITSIEDFRRLRDLDSPFVELYFIDDAQDEYLLNDDPEYAVDALGHEATFYELNHVKELARRSNGNHVEVLGADLEFFLNQSLC